MSNLADTDTIDIEKNEYGDVTIVVNESQAQLLCDFLDITAGIVEMGDPEDSAATEDMISRMRTALRKVYPY